MANFSGTLNSNEIFSSLFNMIISQTVFADQLDGLDRGFVGQFRTDGTLYGDTKLYYAADVLKSNVWGADAEAPNLLALDRPEAPDVQAIVLDQFRQIRITVDNYLSKRAWGTEGAFSSFNSVILGMIGKTKAILDYTMMATFVGTDVGTMTKENITVTPKTGETDAQAISKAIADLLVDIQRPSREYNEYANMDAFAPGSLKFIWNAEYINAIKKIDEPMLRQLGEIISPSMENVLPKEYFGTVNATAGTTGATNTTVRSLVEKDYGSVHVFPGDLVPNSTAYLAKETYTVDPKVICKVMHHNSIPFMSAFEVGTSFFNPRSLTENHYLTWGYNKPEHLLRYPYITVKHS